mgnify:CR=1
MMRLRLTVTVRTAPAAFFSIAEGSKRAGRPLLRLAASLPTAFQPKFGNGKPAVLGDYLSALDGDTK